MSGMTENGTKQYKLKEVCIRLAEGDPLCASARDELNALVKDTAAKVSIDKPKAKTKKGPEL